MNNNPDRPREYDAVLGGQTPPPVQGAVLGGIEGVKRRLASPTVEARIAALSEALKYGEAGLDLVIAALKDNSVQLQRSAGRILRESFDSRAKQALLDFDPWLAFTMLTEWSVVKEFNPEVGITNPVTTAYTLDLDLNWSTLYSKVQALIRSLPSKLPFREEHQRRRLETQRLDREEATKKFEVFLRAPQIDQIQALYCYYPSHCFIDIFVEAKNQLSNLKALFWGDAQDDPYKDTSKHQITRDMSLILEAYPKLEVLHIRGRADGDSYAPLGSCLTFTPVRHKRLKTLIIETKYLPHSTASEIVQLELPNLEYLELWTGNATFDAERLIPIIYEQFPQLVYLGIRSCENADEVAKALASSPLIKRLRILDLSMGTMTNQGVEYLLNCPDLNQLHTLNVSMNYITNTERLDQLAFEVIAEPQDSRYGGDRYCALYE